MAIRVAYLTCEVPGRLDSVRGLKQPRLVPQGGAMSTQTMEPRLELEQNLHMYRQMAKIRAFDEQVNELYKSAKMPGLAHLYIGEEAVAVGVCEALRRDDFITSTHRGHGHCLAKGASVNRMFAELLGKEPGYCRGKGGSMHIADPETGNLGANAIVGGSAGIATGAALSAKMRGTGPVATCFFGDVNREYRTKEEEREWMTGHDPLHTLASRLTAHGLADESVFERIRADVQVEIDSGVQFALAAPYPEVSEVDEDVYA